MKKKIFLLGFLWFFLLTPTRAQEEDYGRTVFELPEKIPLTLYRKKNKEWYQGDSITVLILPELPVYPVLHFKNERDMRRYNRLVYNVKRTLPLAKKVNAIIAETYEILEQLPDKESKDKHIRDIEKSIREQYEPEMKKLTYSQGKLLIKLIDRECNQSSYEIVKAFFGPTKAVFYQIFAFTFRASLKKEYKPETDDKLIERVVRQVEAGIL